MPWLWLLAMVELVVAGALFQLGAASAAVALTLELWACDALLAHTWR